MTTFSATQNGPGASAPVTLTPSISPFNVGFAVVVTGTVSYSVQHSFDSVNWFENAIASKLSHTQDGNYAFPIKQMRVYIWTGTGQATLTGIQAGVP